jgi:serine protease
MPTRRSTPPSAAVGGGGHIAEVEPNGSLSTAQVISQNPVTVDGTMGTTTDSDYYKLTVGAGKTLTST